ncbi:MAG: LamG domain-containing protein, partial [candidate division NC10 bacterium]
QFTRATSESLTVTDNAAMSVGDEDFTISAWVFMDSKPAGNMSIVSKDDGTVPNRSYHLFWEQSGDRFRFQVSDDAAGTNITNVDADGLGAPTTSTWYHLIAWHDATANTINIIVDDGTVDSVAFTQGTYDDPNDFAIGQRGDSALYFDGRIDAVGFWKKVLSAAEITTLYNDTAGTAHPASGNALAADGTGVGITGWDTGAPLISSATTQDNDGDGSVDRAVIVFDEAVDDSTLVVGGFTIGGVTVTGMVTGTSDDDTITLTLTDGTEASGTDVKDVLYTAATGLLTDIAGNALADVLSGGVSEVDGAAPILLSAVRDSDTQITVTLSELAASASITKANDGGFTVTQTGGGPTYAVSAINPGATDDLVVLTVADMAVSGSAGVTVTYATGVNGTVEELASNTLSTSAIAFWRLGEASGSRLDSVGSNDLTDNNTVTQATGSVGDAAQFTRATSESLTVTDNAAMSVGDEDFTISAWVFMDSKPAGNMSIVSKDNGIVPNRSYHLLWEQSGDRFRFQVSDDAAGTNVTFVDADGLGAPTTSTWYHLIAWHDATANTINIIVDDGTVDSVAFTQGTYDDPNDFAIGQRGDGALYFDGRIDAVGFWKKVLSAAEITTLYNDTAGTAHPASGNALGTDGTGVGISGWDTGAPLISSTTTQDNDGDGSVDRAVIVFDKAVDDSTLVVGGFTIGGVTVTGMVTGTVDDNTITLTLTDGTEASGTDA